jgi:hypothetical protein
MRTIIFFCFMCAALLRGNLCAQGIERNDLLVGTGLGFAKITAHYWDAAGADYQSTVVNGLHIPTSAEYALGTMFGIGGHFNYTLLSDYMQPHMQNSSLMEGALSVVMHAPGWPRIDISGYAGLGYARFRNEIHGDFNHELYRAAGASIAFGFHTRFYFSSERRLGIALLTDGTYANFKNAKYSDDYTSGYDFRLNLKRAAISASLFYRF